ncbi:MAG: tryptophan--tRNA ligase [Alphaproteobacteria bacterium]
MRIFSGAQPTGNLHLGNYLGALRNWVNMQNDYECIYSIVDMHAITVWQEPADLKNSIRELAAAYIAAGLDPKKNIIFNQSANPNHAELAWVLSCVARIGWLNKMTQFKDKAGKNREAASVGLYSYPCLMAADILGYKATHVPVGEDQKQHLELSRNIAQKFNHDYKVEFFPQPEPVIMGPATRVMSLRDGSKKMSKSDTAENSRINLADSSDDIAKKIRKAKSDADALPSEIKGLEGRPEATNLVNIYAAISGKSANDVLIEYAGQGFGQFKPALADLLVAHFEPIRNRMNDLLNDKGEIDNILRDGALRARTITQPILDEAYDIVGFLR